jgi:hypothetical protein
LVNGVENAGGWFGLTIILNENDTPGLIPSLRITEVLYVPRCDNVGLIVKVDPEKVTKVGRFYI